MTIEIPQEARQEAIASIADEFQYWRQFERQQRKTR
jgi:hypothetical protein